MKRILLASALAVGNLLFAQQKDDQKKPIYIKANAVFLPVGMLNAALEMQISDKMTLQPEVFISPWKSFGGKHAQLYMGTLDGRYYFDSAFKKWYVGINIGGALFDIQKWNYSGTHRFQRGYAFLAGATVGYQLLLNNKWNLDFYVGGGTSQSFYHGYDETDPDNPFVYYDDTRKWNRSGEFLPYRGGLMISYKLR